MTTRPSHACPTAHESAVVGEMLDRLGLAGTMTVTGLGRHTIARLRGSLPVHRATLTQLRMTLRLAAQQEPRP